MKVPSSAAKKTQVEKKIMDAKLESKKNMNMREKEKYGQKIGRKGDQMPPKSFEYKKK